MYVKCVYTLCVYVRFLCNVRCERMYVCYVLFVRMYGMVCRYARMGVCRYVMCVCMVFVLLYAMCYVCCVMYVRMYSVICIL